MTILDAKYTSMVIRSILATVILFTFLSAQGQSADPAMIATASTLGGTYTHKTDICMECETTETKLQLTPDGKSDGGTYLYTKTNQYSDYTKRLMYRSTGKWYLLKNKVPGDNTTIIVVDINYGDEPETYPMFLVKSDGNLLELNQQFIERYPRYIFKDTVDHELYIEREHGRPLLFKRTLHYKDAEKKFKDPTVDHILKKQ